LSRIVIVFVDGVGLGPAEADSNPLRHPDLRLLANFLPRGWRPPDGGGRPAELPEVHRTASLPFDGLVRATDASLGLPGLPQSATGQTTLLTGENAAEAIGRHLYGYPSPTLRQMLMRASVFKQLADAGKRVAFLNAYRPLFFELGDAVWTKGMSATTWANRAGGAPFRTVDDLRAGRAVYHDITHDSARARGYDIPLRTPEEAGAVLARAGGEFDFVFFEFFQTDKAGHARDGAQAVHELVKLEHFLAAALEGLDLARTTLLVTSDHGNVEDLGTKSHTWNPVPTLLFGERAGALTPRLDRLEAFTPAIVATLTGGADIDTLRAKVDEVHARRRRVQEALQIRLELLARIDGAGGDEAAARELAALRAQTEDAELRVELMRIKREQMETEQAYYDARAEMEAGHGPD
jgi:2,3-bisphosphoglycerate-independent phosphoglycerate mutase